MSSYYPLLFDLDFLKKWILVFSPPLLQVEEVKRRQYSLAFSSAGAQAQTYHVSFETLAEYQRWQRQASKVIAVKCPDVAIRM